jgi:hypothetical protein
MTPLAIIQMALEEWGATGDPDDEEDPEFESLYDEIIAEMQSRLKP